MKHSIRSLLGMVAFLVTAVMITLFIMSFVSIPLPGGSVVLSARDYQAIKEIKKLINIREFLQAHYYQETDPKALEEKAYRGMLEALEDPTPFTWIRTSTIPL